MSSKAAERFADVMRHIHPDTAGTVMALSLKEPWASFVLDHTKTIETRTWSTNWRGDFLVLASRTFDKGNFPQLKPHSPYFGKAIAIARLVDVVRMEKHHETQARCEVYPGAFAWQLANIRPIRPVDIKGQLSLFRLPVEKGQIILL